MEKACTKCGEVKCFSLFHKHKGKPSDLARWCKDCANDNAKRWRLNNPDRAKENKRNYYYGKGNEICLALSRNNSKHRVKNFPELNAASTKLYETRKSRACPKWLTPEQNAHIKRTYKLSKLMCEITGLKHHVDHIIPLKGKNVCGLHVPWNLQVIKASDNLSKSNKFEGLS